jgi:hypothetical protein
MRVLLAVLVAMLSLAAYWASWLSAEIAIVMCVWGQVVVSYLFGKVDQTEGMFPRFRRKTERR